MTQILPRIMTVEEFQPLVGKSFVADCTPKPVPLTLVEASPLRDYGYAERPPFILVFRSAPDALLLAGQYVVRCGAFGPAAIGLSDMLPPPGAEAGYYYQAIFN